MIRSNPRTAGVCFWLQDEGKTTLRKKSGVKRKSSESISTDLSRGQVWSEADSCGITLISRKPANPSVHPVLPDSRLHRLGNEPLPNTNGDTMTPGVISRTVCGTQQKKVLKVQARWQGERKMGNRLVDSILAGIAVLAFAAVSLAQAPAGLGPGRAGGPGSEPSKVPAAPRAPDGTPDLSGTWAFFGTGWTFSKEAAPMTPWAEEQWKFNHDDPDPNAMGRNDRNPGLKCMPYGMPRIMGIVGRYLMEVIQNPRRVLLLFEYNHEIRQIWTDGRKMPDGYPPSYLGYSIGRWVGDTLVVDTAGLKSNNTWLDSAGHPKSDAIRIAERFRRVDQDTLVVDFTFDDPKAYTKPWTGQKVYTLKPGWELMEFNVCENGLEAPSAPVR